MKGSTMLFTKIEQQLWTDSREEGMEKLTPKSIWYGLKNGKRREERAGEWGVCKHRAGPRLCYYNITVIVLCSTVLEVHDLFVHLVIYPQVKLNTKISNIEYIFITGSTHSRNTYWALTTAKNSVRHWKYCDDYDPVLDLLGLMI